MFEEKKFDYENYIQKRLREIDDLDERKYAKELLLEGLGNIFKWTEAKYAALEQRIQKELDIPGERFCTFTTIVERKDYDPINPFWFPVFVEDIKGSSAFQTIYLMADEDGIQEFLKLENVDGIEEATGKLVRFRIQKAERYEEAVKRLYQLFAGNHIPWQSIHMGHLERFFDLIPQEDVSPDTKICMEWGVWEAQVKEGMLPLWNIQQLKAETQEFRTPCIDQVFYEHVLYLPEERAAEDGYLIAAEEDILSIRYEENRVLIKTAQESLQNAACYRLHQGEPAASYGYKHPVLTNLRKNNLSARYLHQTGNFLQTPLELHKKIMELAGNFEIELLGYEISGRDEKIIMAGKIVSGDMNGFIRTQVFPDDKRNILLLRIHRNEPQENYLFESQVRYILSQLQMEFMEYRCMGVLE